MSGMIRTGIFLLIVLFGLMLSAGLGLIWRPDRSLRRLRAQWVHILAPWLLRVLGVRTVTRYQVRPPLAVRGIRPGMTVSNHISYLDVLVVAAQLPTVFVTSTEVRDQPIVGTICRLAGCVFVDRRSARRLRSEIAEVALLMKDGLHVVVFPEATSTRGDEVRPFRRALFEAARAAGVPLWVGRIRYPEGVRMRVSYAEDDAFLPHLRRLLLTRSLEAEWTWLGSLEASELVSRSAAELATWARAQVSSEPFRIDSRLLA